MHYDHDHHEHAHYDDHHDHDHCDDDADHDNACYQMLFKPLLIYNVLLMTIRLWMIIINKLQCLLYIYGEW